MRLTDAERIRVAVICEHCNQASYELLAGLIFANNMPCPSCGGVINLEDGNNAAIIQKLVEEFAGPNATPDKKAR